MVNIEDLTIAEIKDHLNARLMDEGNIEILDNIAGRRVVVRLNGTIEITDKIWFDSIPLLERAILESKRRLKSPPSHNHCLTIKTIE